MADRFLVFSGGKLEHRKGQDLALRAFAIFARRHPEAVLVTAWHSPWPGLAKTLDSVSGLAPVAFTPDGRVDVAGWAEANGIRRDQVLDLGAVPNPLMPPLLREIDVGLFPNRCEGGTNLVAMECMACGVPVILSANTGHLDLIGQDTCYPLLEQRPMGGVAAGFGSVPGWGESDVDEMVEVLERIHRDRAAARERGRRGAQLLSGLSWSRTAAAMKEVVLARSRSA